MMKQLSTFFAFTGIASGAFGASTVEVTGDNSPYQLTADILDVTTLSVAEGCVLDLNGHSLKYDSPYGSGLNGLSGHACVITNSSASASEITLKINSLTSSFGEILSKVAFGGNLKVSVNGRAKPTKHLLNSGNTHTGGTTLDGFWPQASEDTGLLDANSYGRAYGAALGTGELTLKNGSRLFIADGNGVEMPWLSLSVANDAGNARTNTIWFENRAVYSNAVVSVAEGSTLVVASRNNVSQWAGNLNEVRGTLALYGGGTSGGLLDEGTTGFPNAKVKFLKSPGVFQLRFARAESGDVEIGELSTSEDITGPEPNAQIFNRTAYKTLTLKVGGLGTDSTFNGNIMNNSTAYMALEKVGAGTLSIGGTNTYDRVTTLSGGALKLIRAGVIGYGSNADIRFNGGVLAFGDGDDAPIFSDYSDRIKNNASAVAVDTGKGDITWATGLAASNVGGLVKLGEGTLDVAGYSAYTGETIASNGTLKVAFEYNGTKAGFATGRTFAIEDGASLEVTLKNTANARPGVDILDAFPAGAVVNLDADNVGEGYPRWADMSSSTFRGTVNFASAVAMEKAGGFVANGSTFGSADISWGVTGEPETLTRVVDFEGASGSVMNLGSFNWPSANAGIYVRRTMTFNIGGCAKPSVMNGKLLTSSDAKTLTINYEGDSTLTLGSGFGTQVRSDLTGDPAAISVNVKSGTLVNNADLSGCSVSVSAGATISGTGTWPSGTVLSDGYVVAATVSDDTTVSLNGISVDFGKASLRLNLNGFDGSDKTKAFTLLTADGITGMPETSLLDSLNASARGGRWDFAVVNGNRLVLRFFKRGFALSFR